MIISKHGAGLLLPLALIALAVLAWAYRTA